MSGPHCFCCGSTTELKHFVLESLRLWTSCAACVEHCNDCRPMLKGAKEVHCLICAEKP